MSFFSRIALVILTATLAITAQGNGIQDHSFVELEHPSLTRTQTDLSRLLQSGQFTELMAASDTFQMQLENLDATRQDKARYLSNTAIMLAQADESEKALQLTNQAQGLLEAMSAFHPDLYHVLMAKGYILVFNGKHEDAEDALRHAQHISHRDQGVYGVEQLPALRLLTEAQTHIGEFRDADQTQRFLLRVNEQVYGAASEEMIPSLMEVGAYLARRGRTIVTGNKRTQSVFMVGRNHTIDLDVSDTDLAYRTRLFREAEEAYERSIAIIQEKYGATDLRLVDPLKGLSKAKLLEGFSRGYAEKPMERMASIVQQNPGSDVADKAKALVELADLYIKTEDPRAADLYRQAWTLLADDVHEELRYQMFGRPVRLLPEHNFVSYLDRYPESTGPDQQLFVDLNYTVNRSGRVRQVTVAESNIPNRDQQNTKRAIQLMKFRPRMVDGELVDTEGLSLHQTFTVIEKQPEFKAKVDVNF